MLDTTQVPSFLRRGQACFVSGAVPFPAEFEGGGGDRGGKGRDRGGEWATNYSDPQAESCATAAETAAATTTDGIAANFADGKTYREARPATCPADTRNSRTAISCQHNRTWTGVVAGSSSRAASGIRRQSRRMCLKSRVLPQSQVVKTGPPSNVLMRGCHCTRICDISFVCPLL